MPFGPLDTITLKFNFIKKLIIAVFTSVSCFIFVEASKPSHHWFSPNGQKIENKDNHRSRQHRRKNSEAVNPTKWVIKKTKIKSLTPRLDARSHALDKILEIEKENKPRGPAYQERPLKKRISIYKNTLPKTTMNQKDWLERLAHYKHYTNKKKSNISRSISSRKNKELSPLQRWFRYNIEHPKEVEYEKNIDYSKKITKKGESKPFSLLNRKSYTFPFVKTWFDRSIEDHKRKHPGSSKKAYQSRKKEPITPTHFILEASP